MKEKFVYAERSDSCYVVCDATVRYTLKTNGMPPLLYVSPIQLHLDYNVFKMGTFRKWFAEEYNQYFSEFGTFFLNSVYMSICPVTEKDNNQFVFTNGMNYLKDP